MLSIFTSICSFVSSPFLCFVSILSFHTTLPRLKCDCDISSQRHVYSATGCAEDIRFGAECFKWKEDKWHSRMHTYFLLAYVRIEDIDVSDFWNFFLYYRQIYPISVFILKFPLHRWTFPLCSHLDSKIASVSLSLSHEDLHRMCTNRRGKGSETVWKSGFAYLFASKRLLTYALSDSLPFWLSNRQSDLLPCLLTDLTGLSLLLTNLLPPWLTWFSSTLTDPSNWALILTECLSSSLTDVTDSHLVIFLSGWPIQLSSLTDRVSHFFSGWRQWLTIGCLPVSLIHLTEFCY